MKHIAYYHMYLDDFCNWGNIFMEQMTCAQKSGMLAKLDELRIVAISQQDERARALNDLVQTLECPVNLTFIKNMHPNDGAMLQNWDLYSNNHQTESLTLHRVWEASQTEEAYYCYFHTKAVTATLNTLIHPGRITKYVNRYKWRQFLNEATLTNWRTCTNALDQGYNVAGSDWQPAHPRHFRGNVWWAKSSYIKTLPDPLATDWWVAYRETIPDPWFKTVSTRFRDEHWISIGKDLSPFNALSNTGQFNVGDI